MARSQNPSFLGLIASFLLCSGAGLLSACASENRSDETVGTSSAPLTAYCSANVTGVGSLDTESDYLPHVVHCENGGASLESLKAQAVASRTYLYYKMDTAGSIADGQGDQVYSCASEPDADDIEAVNETSGIVLQYKDASIAAFFVAGAVSSPPACMDEGADSTNTVQYVTYNQGLSGSDIHQTSLGFVSPTNYANRGCMSQYGSRCLANLGDSFDTILKFYYGDDIQIVQSTGACVVSNAPDGGSIVQPDGGIVGTKGGTGGTAPSHGDGGVGTSSGDGTTSNESGGCSVRAVDGRSRENFVVVAGFAIALAARKRRKNRRKSAAKSV